MDINHGSRHFGMDLASYAAGPMAGLARRLGTKVRPMTEVSEAPAVPARLNNNRWIVECPDCRGAEFVWLESPLLMCQSCFNGAIDGRWRRVTLPEARGEIEAIVSVRPLPAQRNWNPDEDVESLRAENIEHGITEEHR